MYSDSSIAGMLWSKQFYYWLRDWLKGDLHQYPLIASRQEPMNGFTCLIMTLHQCQTNGNILLQLGI